MKNGKTITVGTLAIAIGGLAILTILHLSVPVAPNNLASDVKLKQFATTCQVLGPDAGRLGLNEDDMLVDPRHPNVFAMYHVLGACNIDPRRLASDIETRTNLENGSKRIILITEDAFSLSYLYTKIKDVTSLPDRWFLWDTGPLFSKIESANSPTIVQPEKESIKRKMSPENMLIRDFPESVTVDQKYRIDRPGRLIQMLTNRPGSLLSISYPSSILGAHKNWRERRSSFLRSETALYATIVKIGHKYASDSFVVAKKPQYPKYTENIGFVSTGRLVTSMEDLDALADRRIERVIFIPDVPVTMSIIEALAIEQLERGGEVLGYMTDRLYVSNFSTVIDSAVPKEKDTATWILLFSLVIGHGILFGLLRYFLGTAWINEDASPVKNLLARLVLALIPVIFGWGSVSVLTQWPQINMWGVFLSDVGRFGWGALSLLSLAANFVIISWIFALSFGPKKAWYWPITSIAILISLLLPVVIGLTVMEATCFTSIVVTPYVVWGMPALVRLARSRR